MGWTQDLCNISYPSLTTATPFISQKIFFKARGLGSNLLPSEPVLKPALPSYTIYSNSLPPSYLWHFNALPRASRGSAIQIFLVIGGYRSLFLLPPLFPSSVDCVETKLEWLASTLHPGTGGGGSEGRVKMPHFDELLRLCLKSFDRSGWVLVKQSGRWQSAWDQALHLEVVRVSEWVSR